MRGSYNSALYEFKRFQLRHIKLENNENKPVTNSRDTQVFNFGELALEKLSIFACRRSSLIKEGRF